ncbi:hypothetical protein EPD60_11365 [Flaviaesturariibacter flavus]|uniref:Uncharacterized protein n=1 Tax=Flaviaesturariibacter flavus TaxID=2502780 RepID=A0A4R1BC21_9BACT|nr:hypothetical protein [Flaviaesturariibacter flavus]TCJ14575.1 hypothetical protein EPD60_11365 [Flaviaesturariibacter flavus]
MKTLAFALAVLIATGSFAQDAPKAPKAPKAPAAPRTEKKVRNFDDVEAELDRAEKSLNHIELPTPPAAPEAPRAEIDRAEREMARAERELAANEHITRKELAATRREMARARTEMARVRESELPRMQEEMKRARVEIDKAKVEIVKARAEMKEYEAFEQTLIKDGLIDKDNYRIEHRDGGLYLNGKKQSDEIYNKYRYFLDKHKRFNWRKSADEGLNIQNGDDRI